MENQDKISRYLKILNFTDCLLVSKPSPELITIYANLVVFIKYNFKEISWVGFYLINKNYNGLILGPYNGPLACNYIGFNNGVCGKCATSKETQIILDVNKIQYHIACDSLSKSEIVLPLIINNELLSVLDIDSHQLATFDEVDKKYLEEILEKIRLYIEKNKV